MTVVTWLLAAVSPASASELLKAARADDRTRVLQLLQSGEAVDEAGPQGDTALHWMAFHGAAEVVRKLLDAGAPIDARVANGNTPLHLAAYNGHAHVAGMLIDRGADRDARTVDGVTPLGWAQRNGHEDTARLLSGRGARSGPQQAESARTATARAGQSAKRALSAPPAGRYRIQLFALGSEQRAIQVREQLRREHADILGDRELVVDPVETDGRTLYRIRSGPLTGTAARETCERLRQRQQSCMVLQDAQP